jgi:hypothetical protein
MKPYNIPNESPFFTLRDGAFQKWESYSGFNSSGYSKNGKKVGRLDGFIQETIQ